MGYKWILFDLDDTIFDFNKSSHYALKDVFQELGIEDLEGAFTEYYQINDSVWRLLQNGKISASELKSLRWENFLKRYQIDFNPVELNDYYLNALAEYTVLTPQALQVLKELYDHCHLIAVTNGLSKVQNARLDISKIRGFFDAIFISEDLGVAKPQLLYFETVFRSVPEIEKDRTILIGDSLESDIKGAENFGIDSCWYNPGNNELPAGYSPTFTIRDLHHTIDIVL